MFAGNLGSEPSSDSIQVAHNVLGRIASKATPAERIECLEEARGLLVDARRARAAPLYSRSLFTSICNLAASDSEPSARCLAPATVEDLCLRELRVFVIDAAVFLLNSLNDANTRVRMRGIRAVTALFRRVLGLASLVGVSGRAYDAASMSFMEPCLNADGVIETFPADCLSVWFDMRDRILSFLHDSHDGLCKAAVKFGETVVLAQSYSGSGSPGSQEHFTLDFAQSRVESSPSLNLIELQEYGSWTAAEIGRFVRSPLESSSSAFSPIRPSPYITAITVLGNLARRRKLLFDTTLPPLLEASSALVNIVNPHRAISMLSKGQRSSVVMVLRLSLHSIRSYTHARAGYLADSIGKACTALAQFEAREYGASLQSRRPGEDRGRRSFERGSNAPPPSNGQQTQNDHQVVTEVRSTAAKRSREDHLPSAAIAGSGANLLMQTFPPSDLINLIFEALQRVRPSSAVANKSSESRPEKKPRGSRFGAVSGGIEKDVERSISVRRGPLRRVTAPTVVPAKSSVEIRQGLLRMLCRRLLGSEKRACSSGASSLRILSLSKLLPVVTDMSNSDSASFCQEAVDYILDNIQDRLELALAWLHVEAVGGLISTDYSYGITSLSNFSEYDLIEAATPHTMCVEDSMTEPDILCGQKNEDIVADIQNNSEVASEVHQTKNMDLSATEIIENRISDSESVDTELQGSLPESLCLANGKPSTTLSVHPTSSCEDHSDFAVDNIIEFSSLGGKYEQLLQKFLTTATSKLGPENRMFTRLLVEAPYLPDSAVEVIIADCRDAARSRLGLCTLRDIIYERPGPDRERCMEALLNLTTDSDDVVRGPATRLVANKLFLDGSSVVQDAIEKYAINIFEQGISGLQMTNGKNLDNGLSSPVEAAAGTFKRNIWLLTALSAKKPSLLSHFASHYINAPSPARAIILDRAGDVAGQLGPEAASLSDLLRNDSDLDTEHTASLNEFFLHILSSALTKAGIQIPAILAESVRVRYDQTKDNRLLMFGIPGFTRKQLLQYLPALFADNENAPMTADESQSNIKEVLQKVITRRPPIINPPDLLVEMHALPVTPQLGMALKSCLEMKTIFREEAIATALQKLIQIHPIPILIMRTALLARTCHPHLEHYIRETVLLGPLGLVCRRIWESEALWTGFLQYCVELHDDSLPLLVVLPANRIADVLRSHPRLRTVVQMFLNKKGKKAKRCCRNSLKQALDQTATE